MKIKTNLSHNSLAFYSAMMWNHGRDQYTADGDNMVELIENEDDPEAFVMDAEWLADEARYSIECCYDMLNNESFAVDHDYFMEGYRRADVVEGHKKYLAERRKIKSFERELAAWVANVKVVPIWEFDTDDDLFITFDASGDRAFPKPANQGA